MANADGKSKDEFADLIGDDEPQAETTPAGNADDLDGGSPAQEKEEPKSTTKRARKKSTSAAKKSSTKTATKPKASAKSSGKEDNVATKTKTKTKAPTAKKASANGVIPASQRNLKPGTKLHATYKGKEHTLTVVKDDVGIGYTVDAKKEVFNSPSSAGKSITGISCNGWAFWSR